jgi:hypothetical protein
VTTTNVRTTIYSFSFVYTADIRKKEHWIDIISLAATHVILKALNNSCVSQCHRLYRTTFTHPFIALICLTNALPRSNSKYIVDLCWLVNNNWGRGRSQLNRVPIW